ncbi:MAG TPA: hypothetical protein VD996_04665, partial [Chitinophagaceae bacterium]|nr:hypothetical protein [Chitinophagaceae bacterium]
MRTIWLLVLLFNAALAQAQSIERKVIASGGVDLTQPACGISFTIGEVSVATFTQGSAVLTQGFQQPFNSPTGGALPLKLEYFTAVYRNAEVALEWKTTQEINTHHFEIERSPGNSAFTLLASVPSKGNSSIPQLYWSADPAPFSPLTYYRLKMVDKDGSFSYSPIVIVKKDLKTGFSLFPNPVVSKVFVSLHVSNASKDTWMLTDMSGRQLGVKQ